MFLVTFVVGLFVYGEAHACGADARAALRAAEARTGRGDVDGALALVREASQAGGCEEATRAWRALEAWREGRRAAAHGGAPDRLGPVHEALAALDALASSPLVREVEYASAAVRAAIAAAQDERGEMAAYLAHARDISERLALANAAPVWPLPHAALEGELWFEVDRFVEARMAYRRAARETARVQLGIARASIRLYDTPAACEAYGAALALDPAPADATEARDYRAAHCR